MGNGKVGTKNSRCRDLEFKVQKAATFTIYDSDETFKWVTLQNMELVVHLKGTDQYNKKSDTF